MRNAIRAPHAKPRRTWPDSTFPQTAKNYCNVAEMVQHDVQKMGAKPIY